MIQVDRAAFCLTLTLLCPQRNVCLQTSHYRHADFLIPKCPARLRRSGWRRHGRAPWTRLARALAGFPQIQQTPLVIRATSSCWRPVVWRSRWATSQANRKPVSSSPTLQVRMERLSRRILFLPTAGPGRAGTVLRLSSFPRKPSIPPSGPFWFGCASVRRHQFALEIHLA